MKKAVKISVIIVAVTAALFALTVGIFFMLIEPSINILGSPDLDAELLTSYERTVKIVDVNGNVLDDALYGNDKIYTCIDDLNDYTLNAFIAIEDKRFYSHSGIDYKRIASAMWSNAVSGSFREGASTITQQLIKNTHLSNEKTIKRKIDEMRLARALERRYSKRRILENYFNILYFGSGIHGIGTASRVMFDKSASELTIAQSAVLASIINNPTKYSPYINPENLTKRKELVLSQMLDQGYIDENEYISALSEQITFQKNKQNQFIDGVIKNACRVLNIGEKELFRDNRTLYTDYDPHIVKSAQKAVSETDGFSGYVRVLVLDNSTGGVVCDETNRSGYIDLRRSPASAIKPFLSYAPALENGMTSLSQINDAPTDFDGYAPKNYKNIYRGYISLKDCLKYSSNIAAVKLVQDIGIDKCVNTAAAFGLPFENDDKNLAAALGGMSKGVTLSELANAYRTLANGGMYSDICYLRTIRSARENTVEYTAPCDQTIAVHDDTAYLLTDMLTECAHSGTAKRLRNYRYIAAKTGTNGDKNGNRDCYCIAYTPRYTIAVWFGADDELLDNSITGAACCKIICKLCDDGAIPTDENFDMPDSVAYYDIDGEELNTSHEVYLADPLLPQRYRKRVLLSKRFLPIRKNIDILDYFDKFIWGFDDNE